MSQTGEVTEVILATNFTNEGEATAHYIAEMLRVRDLRVSRIARGVRLGGKNWNTWMSGRYRRGIE